MEDDEETRNVHEPSLREVEGSATEAKPLETVDITETEQFEFVPESGNSPLLGAQSAVEAKDEAPREEGIAAAAGSGVRTEAEGMSAPELDDSPLAGAVSPIATDDGGAVADFSSAETVVGTKAEEDRVDGALDESFSELGDRAPVGDKSPNTAKDIEAVVVVEENPTAGSKLEIRAEAEQVDVVLGKSVPELDDSQLDGANLPVVAEGGEAAVTDGEISTAGTEMERKCETEVVEGGVLRLVPPDESQPVSAEWPIVDEVVVKKENPRADSEREIEDEVEGIESGAGKFESETLGESHLVAESIIPAKGDDDEEGMAEEETGMEYTEMEIQTEVANEIGFTSVPQLDDSHNVGAESPTEAGDEDEEEEMVAEDEASMPDTEMETETDMAEMAETEKGVGGGKRKRGRNSKVLARAPARKVTEEDVCFICFDGGELVLCDRR